MPGFGPPDPISWLAFTLFAGNWYICLHGWIHAFPVNPLWSVSVEEQFYIAIPVIAFYGGRRGLRMVASALLIASYATVARGAHARTGF